MEGYFVLFLVISIVLFIIGRELVLWYCGTGRSMRLSVC